MSIGEQIKKFRTEKSITQEQLGELVGVSTQAVSKWERGGAPDIELLPALSQALGVSIDALFGNDDRSETLNGSGKDVNDVYDAFWPSQRQPDEPV